jgi:hypothetical protein
MDIGSAFARSLWWIIPAVIFGVWAVLDFIYDMKKRSKAWR